MEFRLTYQGRLPVASTTNTRVLDKHRIRKVLHPQLRELWRTHDMLRYYLEGHTYARNNEEGKREYGPKHIEAMADNHALCGYRFVPLIGNRDFNRGSTGVACSLDILFLRRDRPGYLMIGGDIDNRIKVLFDALRMPHECNEVGAEGPGPDEDPFFCLLADDSLITEVKITTDQLLNPVRQDEDLKDVHLVIRVRTVLNIRGGTL
jgi:hypothetical protein